MTAVSVVYAGSVRGVHAPGVWSIYLGGEVVAEAYSEQVANRIAAALRAPQ